MRNRLKLCIIFNIPYFLTKFNSYSEEQTLQFVKLDFASFPVYPTKCDLHRENISEGTEILSYNFGQHVDHGEK